MALIETRDLWKTYVMGEEEIHALRGVSIAIERGEYVAIMGPSGSGKSTLMNLIGCLDTPTKGSYLLNDKEVASMNDDELARIRNEEIGFVFQTFNLLPRATALHNVELPLVYAGVTGKVGRSGQGGAGEGRAARPRVPSAERALGRTAAARRDRARAREQPVDPAGRRADGQPRLEDRRRDHGRSSSRLHQSGNTIVLVTHEADIAAYAHRVIHIRDGQVENDVETRRLGRDCSAVCSHRRHTSPTSLPNGDLTRQMRRSVRVRHLTQPCVRERPR